MFLLIEIGTGFPEYFRIFYEYCRIMFVTHTRLESGAPEVGTISLIFKEWTENEIWRFSSSIYFFKYVLDFKLTVDMRNK